MGALLFFKGEAMELNEAIKKVERMLNHDDLEFCVLTEDESEAVKRILVAAEIDIDKVKND